MNSREYIIVASIMAAVLYGAVAIVETTQLHFLGNVSEAHDPAPTSRPQFGTFPPDCGHLYNKGQHQEWAACMNVEYK